MTTFYIENFVAASFALSLSLTLSLFFLGYHPAVHRRVHHSHIWASPGPSHPCRRWAVLAVPFSTFLNNNA
jgi:hypothetical protein